MIADQSAANEIDPIKIDRIASQNLFGRSKKGYQTQIHYLGEDTGIIFQLSSGIIIDNMKNNGKNSNNETINFHF